MELNVEIKNENNQFMRHMFSRFFFWLPIKLYFLILFDDIKLHVLISLKAFSNQKLTISFRYLCSEKKIRQCVIKFSHTQMSDETQSWCDKISLEAKPELSYERGSFIDRRNQQLKISENNWQWELFYCRYVNAVFLSFLQN